MKKNFYILLPLLLTSCIQEASNIVYKEGDGTVNNTTISNETLLQPSYMRGTYVQTEDNRVVRDIRATKEEKKEEKEENSLVEVEQNDLVEYEETPKTKTITVKRGDNLIALSKKYSMRFSDIVELNNLEKPYDIYVGQKLKIYADRKIIEDKEPKKYETVIVDVGDTLLRIAINHGMTLREVATINNIEPPYNVYVGQQIKVVANSKKISNYHTVKKGDNLYTIAKQYNTTVKRLISDNNLERPYNIYPEQELYVGKDPLSNSRTSQQKTQPKKETKKETKKEIVKETKKPEKTKEIIKQEAKQQEIKAVEKIPAVVQKEGSFTWPVKGEVIKKFGKQSDGKFYDAINIKAEQGTSIVAVADGEVAYAGNELKGYGNIIIIKHDSGWLSIYGYCDKINVKVKDKVSRGQTIATVGRTGNVDEPQLYFTMRKGRVAMDPLKYLKNN